MKMEKVRELIRKRTVRVGGVVLAAALVFTGGVVSWRNSQSAVPELVSYVDADGTISIEEDEIPLGAPKVTKSTKVKTTKKKIKLKKASTKTYVKNGKATSKTTTKKSKSGNTTTTTVTVKDTSVQDQFKKGSKIQTRVTTVTTTITKSVLTEETAATAAAYSRAAVPATASASGEVSANSIAAKADQRVLGAFNKMGFKIVSNPSVNYSGLFDARTRTITLKTVDETAYHELGHFVGFVAGNYDRTAAFQAIYNREKAKYTYYNKSYVLSSASEYFAESFKNYTLNPSELKANRPETYAAIESALAKFTDSNINNIMRVYGAIWG